MKPGRKDAILALLTVALGVALSIIVNLFTGDSLSTWDQASSLIAAAFATLALGLAVLTSFVANRSADEAEKTVAARERLAFELIRTFAELEKEVAGRREPSSGWRSSRTQSVRDIKSFLASDSTWSEKDRISFDIAIRTRNAVVHGDLESLDRADLQYSVEKAKQLLVKIRESKSL